MELGSPQPSLLTGSECRALGAIRSKPVRSSVTETHSCQGKKFLEDKLFWVQIALGANCFFGEIVFVGKLFWGANCF